MKERFTRVAFSTLLLFTVLTGLFASPSGLPARLASARPLDMPQAQPIQGTLPFAPVTLADIGPIGTSLPSPTWLGLSGDWVAYAIGRQYCGHCGALVSGLYLQHAITGEAVKIRPSSGTGQGSDIYETASDFRFSGGILTWKQPTVPLPGQSTFTPGDYQCGTCFYNVTTHQGGEWTGGTQPADPPSDFLASNEPGPPPNYDPTTFKVLQKSTNRLVIDSKMEQYQRAGMIITGTDKVVFVQTQFAPGSGSLGSPQLIRLQWLISPDPAFAKVWAKADSGVAAGKVSRSWLWGPAPNAIAREAYAEGQNGQHIVQYYDKSRMEVNNPNANPNDPFYVSNGLLTTEMMASQIQIGDMAVITASVPCTIPVAGDPFKDNPLTPSYATLASVASLHGNNQAPDRTGQYVADAIDVNGVVSAETVNGRVTRYAAFVPQTGHNIPALFNDYLKGMQGTYGFDWTFVLGYPITEAYWTQMRVSGKDMPVMIQAYQRRVLTYVPGFPPEWRIQQGNVGQHYFEWRYSMNPYKPLAP